MGNRIEKYLAVVPLEVLTIVPLATLAVFFLIPRRARLYVALSFMVVWLATNQWVHLGIIQQVAKPTIAGAFLLVALAALLHPGPRRHMPGIVWLYPLLAVIEFAYITTVTDREFALVLRFHWLLLTLAALLVTRCIIDNRTLMGVIYALLIGFIIIVLIMAVSLVINPDGSFHNHRFYPLGGQANHGGIILTPATALLLYVGIRTRRYWLKPVLFGLAALSVTMAILTLSRSNVITILMVCLPLVMYLTRRPVLTITAVIVFAVGLSWLFGYGEAYTDLERLESLETGRIGIFGQYMMDVVMERPLTGLMVSQGHSIGHFTEGNPHNAYLHLLYLGGMSLFLPMFYMVIYSSIAAFKTWRKRFLLDNDPLLITTLVAFLITIYAHGFVNKTIVYSTESLPFFHIMFASLFICAASDLRSHQPQGATVSSNTLSPGIVPA